MRLRRRAHRRCRLWRRLECAPHRRRRAAGQRAPPFRPLLERRRNSRDGRQPPCPAQRPRRRRRPRPRGPHRRKRLRKPCEGMMLHQDGSPYGWLEGAPELDLIVTLDDATSKIYSAFLVEEEGTVSTFQALLDVFTAEGLPSSLYTDRGSHYFLTPTAGEAVDKERLTQGGRALARLGIGPNPARSPRGRGPAQTLS